MSLGTYQLSSSQENKLPVGTAKVKVAISQVKSLVIVPSTFPSAAAYVSTRCFHQLWAGLSWDHFVFHSSKRHFSLVFLVSYSPWCKKGRGRKGQRVNVHCSELLGVARCAGYQEGNPAGPNNPLTLQVPFSLVQHRGGNISEQVFTLQFL